MKPGGFADTPADAIALNRVAALLRHRNAQSRRVLVATIQHFKKKKAATPLFATAYRQKLGALFQARRDDLRAPGQSMSRPPRVRSGGKTLATACAASGNYATAARGGHTCTETVATLANKLGGLIGALHLFKYRGVRPFFILSCIEQERYSHRHVVARRFTRPNVARL